MNLKFGGVWVPPPPVLLPTLYFADLLGIVNQLPLAKGILQGYTYLKLLS